MERPHLDRQRRRPLALARPLERRVKVRRFHDAKSAHVLLAFRERTIRQQLFAVFDTQYGRAAWRVEPTGEDPRAGRLQFLVKRLDVATNLGESPPAAVACPDWG